MGYLLNGSGLIQFSGTITDAEVATLGSSPFIFPTPKGFIPLSFLTTPISGTTPHTFTSELALCVLSNFRTFMIIPLLGTSIDYLTINLDLSVPNNICLTPSDSVDPISGDYSYKYNLTGFIAV